jgi:hypothetical protein
VIDPARPLHAQVGNTLETWVTLSTDITSDVLIDFDKFSAAAWAAPDHFISKPIEENRALDPR